jgi:hypothetical protein
MKTVITPLLVTSILILFFSGCYVEPSSADDELTLNIDLNSQAPVGYAGDGYYIKASIYDAEAAEEMLDNRIIYFEDVEGIWTHYYPDQLYDPLNVQAFFLGINPMPNGLILVADLPPNRRYRVFLERIDYYSGSTNTDNAGITDEFGVSSGLLSTVSAELYYAYQLS